MIDRIASFGTRLIVRFWEIDWVLAILSWDRLTRQRLIEFVATGLLTGTSCHREFA
jgi:hypothetical protein